MADTFYRGNRKSLALKSAKGDSLSIPEDIHLAKAVVVRRERNAFKTKMRLFALAATLVFSLPYNNAWAQCGTFPDHPLWSPLTHDRVQNYVKRSLKGDWESYIVHLKKQLVKVGEIVDAGKSARIKHKGQTVTLSGEKLAHYKDASQTRLDVVQCLAEQDHESELVSLDNLPSDKGGEEQDVEVPVTAVARKSRLKLEMSSSCSDGVSRFKITNRGPDWPKASSFSIFRIEGADKYPVSLRRMRLKSGQTVSFTVKKSRNPSGNLGLFVDPGWYKRAFVFDATLTCR